ERTAARSAASFARASHGESRRSGRSARGAVEGAHAPPRGARVVAAIARAAVRADYAAPAAEPHEPGVPLRALIRKRQSPLLRLRVRFPDGLSFRCGSGFPQTVALFDSDAPRA